MLRAAVAQLRPLTSADLRQHEAGQQALADAVDAVDAAGSAVECQLGISTVAVAARAHILVGTTSWSTEWFKRELFGTERNADVES